MKNWHKIIIYSILAQVFCVSSSFAITKLSSPMRSIKSKYVAIQDQAVEIEEIANQAYSEFMRYKTMIESGELAEMAKNYAISQGKDLAKAGATALKNKASAKLAEYQEKRKKKQEMKKKEKQRDAAAEARKDYADSTRNAQLDKNKKIDERLTELKSKANSKNINDDERKQIVEEIASLEAQKQNNIDRPIENDDKYREYEEKEKELTAEVNSIKQEVGEAESEEKLEEKNLDLFADEKEDENKSIYQTEIDSLFLKENEESTSENLARIKKNRGREYYYAVQNAMQVAVVGGVGSPEIEEKLAEYLKMSGASEGDAPHVEGNLPLKNANIGVVIESAKAAAFITETLLADMRLKTMKDMMAWNNKNHLYDYKKPITEFDFDSYELKKENLKDRAKDFYNKNKGKIGDFYNSHKGDIQNIWHKI